MSANKLVVSRAVSLLIDSILLLLRSIAPLSFVGLGVEWFAHRKSNNRNRSWLRKAWLGWMLSEAAFFVYCKLLLAVKLQRQPSADKIAHITPQERRQLFTRCLDNVASPEAFIESWFLTDTKFHHLTLDNVREFLAWGMFHRHDHRGEEMPAGEREELEGLVELFLARCTLPLAAAENRDVEPARLMKFTADPVTHTHRPLALYVLFHHLVQEMAAPLRFAFKFGFQRKQCRDLAYYVLRGSGKDDLLPPLVFVHGIGIGLLPYDLVVADLVEKTQNARSPLFGRSVVLIELHATSQRIAPGELLRDGFVGAVRELFAREELDRAVFLGHSYGSFAVGWVCQRAPELVAGVGLLDPACLFLHHPKALHSIVYKQPDNAVERAMHFLFRSELHWNFHVRRNFFWYANVLFLESCGTAPVLVVLSEKDVIVPVAAGKSYVESYADANNDTHKVQLVYLPGCEHGEFLFNEPHRQRVIAGVEWIAQAG